MVLGPGIQLATLRAGLRRLPSSRACALFSPEEETFGGQRLAERHPRLLHSLRTLPGTGVIGSGAGSREERGRLGGGSGADSAPSPQPHPSAGPADCVSWAPLLLLLLLFVSLGFFTLQLTTLVQGEWAWRGLGSSVPLGFLSGVVFALFHSP